MIVVSQDAMRAANFSAEFYKYAKEKGIRDPFEVSRKIFAKRTRREGTDLIADFEWDSNGKIKEDLEEPSRQEKDAYIIMRNEYVARRCFYEIGYESFLFHTQPSESAYDISYMRDLDEFMPCKSADRQCAFYCKNIGGNCNEENL